MAGLQDMVGRLPPEAIKAMPPDMQKMVHHIREGTLDQLDEATKRRAVMEAEKTATFDLKKHHRRDVSPSEWATLGVKEDILMEKELERLSEETAKGLLSMSKEDWEASGIEKPDFAKPLSYDTLVKLDRYLGNKGVKTSDFERYFSEKQLKEHDAKFDRLQKRAEILQKAKNWSAEEFENDPNTDPANSYLERLVQARQRRIQKRRTEKIEKLKKDMFLQPGDLLKALVKLVKDGKYDDAIAYFKDALDWDPQIIGFEPIDMDVINVILGVYARLGRVQDALKTYELITKYDFDPALSTFNTMISLGAQVQDPQFTMQWYGKLLERGLKPDQITYSCIIHCYAQMGDKLNAEKWFNEMRGMFQNSKPDATAYGHMIFMHGITLGDLPEALRYAKFLVTDKIPPNSYTTEILAQLHTKIGEERAKRAQTVNARPKTVQVQLLDAFHVSDTVKMEKLWESMRYNNAHLTEQLWSIMIQQRSNTANLQGAVELFQQLQEEGHTPSRITCSTMVQVYRRLGDVEAAQTTLQMLETAPASEPLPFSDHPIPRPAVATSHHPTAPSKSWLR